MAQPRADIDARPAALALPLPLVLALVALWTTLIAFSNLGYEALYDWDEGWHARIALDIARHDTFINYSDGGELNTAARKPPLYFWAMALAIKAIGPHEFAIRVFSATCFLGTILTVVVFSYRAFNPTVALVVALLLSTDQLFVHNHHARNGEIDAPLVLFLTLTMLGVWRWRWGGPVWWLPFCWAAALLTKGPAALQIVPAVGLWLLLERAWRPLRSIAVIFALGALPLLAFLIVREQYQPGALSGLFGVEMVGRLASSYDTEARPAWRYFTDIAASAWPVLLSLALVAGAVRGRLGLADQISAPDRLRPLLRLLLLWWLIPFAIFLVARTRHPWYLHPSLVPAFILAGWTLRAALARLEHRGGRHPGPLVAGLIVLGLVLPALERAINPRIRSGLARDDMVRLIRTLEHTDEPLVGCAIPHAVQFYLRRDNQPYRNILGANKLPAELGALTEPVLLLYEFNAAAEVETLLANWPIEPVLEMPYREARLVRVRPPTP